MNTKKLYIYNLFIKLLPPTRCNSIKIKLLRWCGAKVGSNVSLFSPTILGNFDLIIGDNVWIGHEALIFGAENSKIEICDNAKVGTRAILVTGYHDYSIAYPNIAGPGKYANIKIMAGACVGTQAIILPGKIVGEKSHVVAGAVVSKDIPPHVRVGGVPAKIIKDFDS